MPSASAPFPLFRPYSTAAWPHCSLPRYDLTPLHPVEMHVAPSHHQCGHKPIRTNLTRHQNNATTTQNLTAPTNQAPPSLHQSSPYGRGDPLPPDHFDTSETTAQTTVRVPNLPNSESQIPFFRLPKLDTLFNPESRRPCVSLRARCRTLHARCVSLSRPVCPISSRSACDFSSPRWDERTRVMKLHTDLCSCSWLCLLSLSRRPQSGHMTLQKR